MNLPFSQPFIEQAKLKDPSQLGYEVMHGGSFFDITIKDTEDTERVFLGDSTLVWFNLGVLMERYRNECATKTNTQQNAGTTNAQSAEKPRSGAGTPRKRSGKPKAETGT